MYEMRSAYRGAAYARRPFGRFPLGFVPFLVFLGFIALASIGPYFPFFPFIPLLLLLVFFAAPAMRRSAVRGGVGSRRTVEARASSGGEKELLRALERHEEITAARAALETSLSVARAEEMLAKLASGGHVEVRAREGTLAYALPASDRREAPPKELADAGDALP
jgi:membrane protein implicated in regulation of membrane protease activity